ncbi:MAG: DUF6036 family nucleotidyltransferase [Ktedonobacteraceae bacterium]
MNKRDIEKYLRMVGQELHEQGLNFDIVLLGGAAMIIEVGNRNSTQDIDTYFLPDYMAISKAAALIANREGLPDSWLNSAAAGFTFSFIKEPSTRLWKKFPGLSVYLPSLEYLLVTKIIAGRPKDESDIEALTKRLHIVKQQGILDLMIQYVPEEQITPDIMLQIELRFDE